jgi:hypothetical protein
MLENENLPGCLWDTSGALLDRPYRVNDIIWGPPGLRGSLITALIRSASAAPEPAMFSGWKKRASA